MAEKNEGYLSLEQFRKAGTLNPFDLEVPALGGKVRVKPLNLEQRHQIRKLAEGVKKNPDGNWVNDYDAEELEVQAIIHGCVAPKFQQADKGWLKEEVSSGAIGVISKAIFEASGMGAGAEKKPEPKSSATQN